MFASHAESERHLFPNITRDVSLDMLKYIDKHTNIVGLSDLAQKEFMEKHLCNFSKDEKMCIIEKITEMKRKNIIAFDFLRCPLFFLMIVLLLTEKELSYIEHLKSRIELYKDVMNFIVRRYLTKVDDEQASTADLFNFDNKQRPVYVDLMTQLGQMSLDVKNINSLSFTQTFLESHPTKDKGILELGILTKTICLRGLRQEIYYEPVHKSLVEFVAAYFLWSEFKTGRLQQWTKYICKHRPTLASSESSLLFPFLAELMGKEGGAVFEALRPYAAEYIPFTDPLIPTLGEMQKNESVVTSLIPFIPSTWRINNSTNASVISTLLFEIANTSTEVQKVRRMYWDLEFPLQFTVNIDVYQIDAEVSSKMSRLTENKPLQIKCNELLCTFADVENLESKWEDLVYLISCIQFQRISFWFDGDLRSTLHILPFIYKAATEGELRNSNIHWIAFPLYEKTITLLPMLNDLIREERIECLQLFIYFLPSQQQLDTLFETITKSSNLTTFKLWDKEKSGSLTVDLAQLFDGGRKSYEWICMQDARVICNHRIGKHNFHMKLLEVIQGEPNASISRLFETCSVDEFLSNNTVLEDVHHLMNRSIRHLGIYIDKEISEEFFTCVRKFHHLQTLTLKLLTFEVKFVTLDKSIFELLSHLPQLKGFTMIYANFSFAKAVVESIIKYLKKHSTLPRNGTPFPVAAPSESFTCSLQYLALHPRKDLDVSKRRSTDEADMGEFISLITQLKQPLAVKILPRLDIICSYAFSDYMSKFQPNGICSFVQLFPPEEKFSVSYDLNGMREDDTWEVKKNLELFGNQHRYSISFADNV